MSKISFMTPVVTAFNLDGSLDVQGNKNVYEHLIKGGVDGIVVMGSTGEFFSMSMQDKKKLVDGRRNHQGPHPAADRRQLHGLARDRGTGELRHRRGR